VFQIFLLELPENGQRRPATLTVRHRYTTGTLAPLSPLQTAWTGFDPKLYSGGSSSAGPALVEIATEKIFYTRQGHCDLHNVCHTPGARMVSRAFHFTKAVVMYTVTYGYMVEPHIHISYKERYMAAMTIIHIYSIHSDTLL